MPGCKFKLISGMVLFAWLACSIGCRTTAPLPPVDTAHRGWTLRQGHALWRARKDAPDIAGEIVFAANPDGQTLLQFTKNPLPFVTVQTRSDDWQIEFVPQKRKFSGKGIPNKRLMWVHLARALSGGSASAPDDLKFSGDKAGEWQLENSSTGEKISGYLAP